LWTCKPLINELKLDKLQTLRNRFGKSLFMGSTYRSPEYFRLVCKATRPKNMDVAAFDMAGMNRAPGAFEIAAREAGPLCGSLHLH
jgi:hypothetical protein